MEIERFEIEAVGGARIAGEVLVAEAAVEAPVVAIGHGFGEHRRSLYLPALAERLAAKGFAAVAFDFSTTRDLGGGLLDPDRLKATTATGLVDDVDRVLTAIFERTLPLPKAYDIRRIGYVGRGLGAAAGLARAKADSRLRALVLHACPARWSSFVGGDVEAPTWREAGAIDIKGADATERHAVAYEFHRDLDRNAEALDLLDAATELRVPFCLVHGEDDARIPIADARALFFRNSEHAWLRPIPGAGHRLEGEAAVDATVEFLERHLAAAP